MRGGYLQFPIDERYGIPKAGPGVYQVVLKLGDREWRQTLEVREDPLK